MRRSLIVPLGLLGALAACARGPASMVRDTEGGTLVIASPGDADILLPPVAGTQTANHVVERIFPRLAELGLSLSTVGDSSFTPVVARSWQQRDSLTIVFHLDPRARWQDGVPITADDVVYTFDVYRDTATGSPFRVNLAPIASVTREDSLTVAFRFHRRYPEQLYDATYHLKLIPRHLLDSIPHERLASSAFARDPTVGAGPFRFAHWEHGAEIALEADTTWFLGRPHLARIVWRIMPDVSAAVSALLAGEADAMEAIPLRDEIERVRRASGLTLMPYPSPFIASVNFNLARPLFRSPALRRAIAMLIDRQTIVQSVFGDYATVPTSAVTRMVWIADSDVRPVPWDTAAAAALLDSLGWRRGAGGRRERAGRPLGFTLLVPTTSRSRQDAAVIIQRQLQQAGVTMTIEPVEYALFERNTHAGAFDAAFTSRTLDPSPAFLAQFYGSGSVGTDNIGAYRSAAFDSAFARAAAAPSRDAALPLWRAALQQLNDDAPAVFIFSLRNNAAIHRRFEHVTIRPDSWLATVATWSVAPDRRLPRDR